MRDFFTVGACVTRASEANISISSTALSTSTRHSTHATHFTRKARTNTIKKHPITVAHNVTLQMSRHEHVQITYGNGQLEAKLGVQHW